MSFTFEARTLLELGKELISSDDVALYELIKNSVDAKSPKVDVLVTSRLPHSDFREVVRRVEETDSSLEDICSYLAARFEKEDDRTRALLEELESTEERDEFVEILSNHYRDLNQIVVKDTGEGMSLRDLRQVFLRIGTRSRRERNEAGETLLGDKGIGRLSAMRLGEKLRVKTSKTGETFWNRLFIDWSLFSHSEEKLVEEIPLKPVRGRKKEDPAESGTRIAIRDLSADWTWTRFNDLLEGRIARFIDPFQAGLANKRIRARHNGKRALIPSIPKRLLDSAHAVCTAELSFEPRDDGEGVEPVITGTIRYGENSTTIEARGVEVLNVTKNVRKRRAKRGHAQFEETPISIAAIEKLGGFKAEIYWYNRRIVEAIAKLTESQAETRKAIRQWSGGPMLYRHGFRVLPYGDPDDDWLSLDKDAFGQSGFKLNRQQVIGRVSIDTPHHHLSEQTNREGLVQSEVSDALVRIMGWVVHNEFRNFINQIDDLDALQKRQEEFENNRVVSASKALEKVVDRIEEEVGPDHKEVLAELRSKSASLQSEALKILKNLDKIASQSADDREKFVYLAGIGLMTEFIFHELERAVAGTMQTLSQRGAANNLSSLREQLKTLHKRISAFDEMTGEKRQSKSRFDLAELIRELMSNHQSEFERHGIEVELDLPEDGYTLRAVKGMVIQIIENLIVNSAYWLKIQKEYEEGFEPTLSISLRNSAHELVIADNGPGVPVGRKERIFQPFVTAKPAGTGKGLGLYIARELADYHNWTLEMTGDSGDVRPRRLNAFVLRMEGA